MDEKLIKELRARSILGKKFEESESFANNFGSIFKDAFQEISNQYYTDFKIPNCYIQFLRAFPNGIWLGDHSFFGTLECVEMTFDDITLWTTLDDEKKNVVPWIFVGVRGDKGNIYLCCDSSSEYFGKIEEFYDGSAFMGNAFYENMKLETFEELLLFILNKK